GARSAGPGEFTQRAFLNGKMDLTQAEAVMDIISAQTGLALKAAQHQLGGRIGEATENLRGELLEIVAH
ncbi:MAG: tRNA uridine-5-carboxymethylaminomethyl(34) synthesis GTPase MnmE, partial [Akkermansiaceae bacterium]|nr:tRNA uridine-5-carboxymethylaminomethyl(34) synthesis GTPase MnmE [Akkermansiaceae bacterium]